MRYKTTNGLMKHLRDAGINIYGAKQKRQLINIGYFHGYKGYRFFKDRSKKIPFSSFDEVVATVKYDSELKSLFYSKIMYIETAVKNIALQRIIVDADSENIYDMYNNVVAGYNYTSPGIDENARKIMQKKKLRLEKNIQSYLYRAYDNDDVKITHFYNNMSYSGVPLWALFEILTLGDFANLLSCLKLQTRDNITQDLKMKVAVVDTNRELIFKYMFLLKDLRNAIAHNSVIFDTRFNKMQPSPAMKKCLEQAFCLPYINFKTIGDYIILVCYYLKLLEIPKREIKSFINDFVKTVKSYKNSVSTDVYKMVIHPDFDSRMEILKKYL